MYFVYEPLLRVRFGVRLPFDEYANEVPHFLPRSAKHKRFRLGSTVLDQQNQRNYPKQMSGNLAG